MEVLKMYPKRRIVIMPKKHNNPYGCELVRYHGRLIPKKYKAEIIRRIDLMLREYEKPVSK
jgi:hypothetical protein